MRISTHEFLLGSLNDMLAQQQNVNQLNREIATGETMLDAGSDPGGAAQVIGFANQIGALKYDAANGQAATQNLQVGMSALQQVSTLLLQLRQTATAAANGTATSSDRQAYVNNAKALQQQLIQLANTQNANGGYLFAGSRSNGPAFSVLPSGKVVFNGDNATNQVQIAPSLNITSTVSGQNIFMNVAAGAQGVTVSAAAGNAGTAYAVAQGLINPPQVSAASLAGTQYDVSFAAGSGSSLTYQVTSGHGAPGSAGYNATSGVVASGGYIPNSDLSFGGIQVQVSGTPVAGDSFAVRPGATTSLFQTVQDLAAALALPQDTGAEKAQAQQALQNVIADINGAQTGILSAQATLGTSLSEIQSVQNQTSTQSANANTAIANLQSANLPQVLAAYSEGLTALQAAQLSFAKLQNLTLFQYIRP